jgi:hypothetical protein
MSTIEESQKTFEASIAKLMAPADFDPAVFEYLQRPIAVKDRAGNPLYVYVQAIERPTPKTRGFLRFSFRVRRKPDPKYTGPTAVGEKSRGRRAIHGTLFHYVFSDKNSLLQNKRNLEDFVILQCGAKQRRS